MLLSNLRNLIDTFGNEASFIANLIILNHQRPGWKLAGLLEILQAGHHVALRSFSSDTLLIDGRAFGWAALENPKLVAASLVRV